MWPNGLGRRAKAGLVDGLGARASGGWLGHAACVLQANGCPLLKNLAVGLCDASFQGGVCRRGSAVVRGKALFTGDCRNVGGFCCVCGVGQTGIRLQAMECGANALGSGWGRGKSHCFWVREVGWVIDRFGNHSPMMLAVSLSGLPLGLIAQPKENGCWKMTNLRSVHHA